MTARRREFLAGCAASVLTSGLGTRFAAAQDTVPVLGLIFPPFGRGVPEEGVAMYGERLRFVVTGLGLDRMTPDGYDSVIGKIPAAARQLADAGAHAIELTGTVASVGAIRTMRPSTSRMAPERPMMFSNR